MIWLIGGTSDALKIADLLLVKNKEVLVSTTTSYGAQLAGKSNVHVVQEKLNLNDMINLLAEYSINTVIDASHPFANVVSQDAIVASKKAGARYIRFERQSTKIKEAAYYDSYAQMVDRLRTAHGNILLTIGSKNIHQFSNLTVDRIIARVLPVNESIELCNSAGLKAHQIIAMKGRMNKETNKALMLEYDIKHLVSKDSGEAGGLIEKVDAALELGIKVHILNRPKISYPKIFDKIEDVNQFI